MSYTIIEKITVPIGKKRYRLQDENLKSLRRKGIIRLEKSKESLDDGGILVTQKVVWKDETAHNEYRKAMNNSPEKDTATQYFVDNGIVKTEYTEGGNFIRRTPEE